MELLDLLMGVCLTGICLSALLILLIIRLSGLVTQAEEQKIVQERLEDDQVRRRLERL